MTILEHLTKGLDHAPDGDPCRKCGKGRLLHRVSHRPVGEPCSVCGLFEFNHRYNSPEKALRERERKQREEYKKKQAAYRAKYNANQERLFLGIDGEGQGRRNHKYVLLAASDESGSRKFYIENFNGLSTVECLDFLLGLPKGRYVKNFAYSFNYDLTKILADLDEFTLYRLFRPEKRLGRELGDGPQALWWKDYQLNIVGTRFSIAKEEVRMVLWDVFKFYQSRFISACEDWKVGSPESLKRMSHMKDQRADFDKLDRAEVREYCFEECQYMAGLARKLVEATDKADLKLTSFHGAGSVASSLLKKLKIKEQIRDCPPEMRIPLAQGFFGGRFENSVIGSIKETVYNYDISSAYPYHITFLPCLVHGVWELVKDRRELEREDVAHALVRYSLGPSDVETWGPFPFRMADGAIAFPVESGGGWIWRDEYLAGERIFPNVKFREAWVLRRHCDCQPFAEIPNYYTARVYLGKDGPGIVIKLGYNAVYGKIAQSVGNAEFNNWAWAGMITSGCRAQVLEALALHHDWSNLLIVATDGIYTREELVMPAPRYTGTDAMDAPCEAKSHIDNPKCKCGNAPSRRYIERGKPLGGWEKKTIKKGVFIARPGIYFPMHPTEDEIKDVRGRGVGKGVVLQNWREIVDSWERGGIGTYAKCDAVKHSHRCKCQDVSMRVYVSEPNTAKVANVSRFCGAKTSISYSAGEYHRSNGQGARTKHYRKEARRLVSLIRETHNSPEYNTDEARWFYALQAQEARSRARNSPSYGQWVTREVALGFDPKPKREGVNADGLTLKVRRVTGESQPYSNLVKSQEARDLAALYLQATEQPDADLADYEVGEF